MPDVASAMAKQPNLANDPITEGPSRILAVVSSWVYYMHGFPGV